MINNFSNNEFETVTFTLSMINVRKIQTIEAKNVLKIEQVVAGQRSAGSGTNSEFQSRSVHYISCERSLNATFVNFHVQQHRLPPSLLINV